MKKIDIVFYIGLLILGFLIFREITSSNSLVNKELSIINKNNSIYFYGAEDEEIKNPELLEYFVDNVKNNLNSVFYFSIVGDYEQEIIYRITYNSSNKVFLSDVIIEGAIFDSKEYNYFHEYVFEEKVYYFLSNKETLLESDVNNYFNGNCFDLFEIGRK